MDTDIGNDTHTDTGIVVDTDISTDVNTDIGLDGDTDTSTDMDKSTEQTQLAHRGMF